MSNHFAAPGRARRAAITIVALGLLAAGVGATSAGASASTGRQRAEQVVSERVRGEAAIRALGTRLPEVAAANGTTAEELRGRLRADDELWVDPSGLLLYIDETLGEHADHDHAEAPSGTVDPVLGSPSTADALALHSRPGASRVLFLDFDGHASPGSGWSGTAGTPYDTDGSPSTFSDAERRVIIDVWRHVAEDYAPFGIDVTTQDPGIDAIRRTTSTDAAYGTRVVVTPTKTDCTSCGGIAYVGTYDIHGSDSSGWYHDRYQPAWVYVAGTNAKSIAEAASHEAGHNLGLSHDGVTGGTAYYAGHGDWAPIMGVGYYEPITQWSKGEYSGASNTEDDLAVIAANGGTPVADDHGATPTTATAIAAGTVDVSGVIGTRGDQDAFTFTAGPGTLSLQVAPATVGPDVDLSLRLLDGSGTTMQLLQPTGLSATLEQTVAAGTYTVVVDGVGAGDPGSSGYSDYASLGRYRLSGTVPVGGTTPANQAPVASATATPTSGTAPLAVRLDSSASTDPDGSALTHTWDLGDGRSATGSVVEHTYGAGTHTATVTVSDGTASSTASVTITVADAPTVTKPAAPTLGGTVSGSTVELAWGDVSGETAYDVYREVRHRNGSYRSRTLIKSLGADVTSTTDAPGSGTFRYQVVARNSAGSSGSNLVVLTVGSSKTSKTSRTQQVR